MKKICILGLGYVGVVTAACLAKEGNKILGVDISATKVDLINKGQSPIIEDQIDELVRSAVSTGNFAAFQEPTEPVLQSDIIFVCVGTPSAKNGSLFTGYVQKVCEDLGQILKNSNTRPLIVIRSTLLPGSMEKVVIPGLEIGAGGKPVAEWCRLVFHPEFLREGSSVHDFYNPPKIVIGEEVSGDGEELLGLYKNIEAPIFQVGYEVAEMVKYCDNMFHALKVTFANEIGQYCFEKGIDSHEVMNIFTADTKLNISDKYLRPGFAFGGSCLPKDLRAFLYTAQTENVITPMLRSVLESNDHLINQVADYVLSLKINKIGVYGLSFKKGTDDLRESPIVSLVEILLGKGIKISIFDEFVQVAKLLGGNKAYINEKLPHISDLMVANIDDLKEATIILGHQPKVEEVNQWVKKGVKLIDLNHPGGTFFRRTMFNTEQWT